MATTYTPGTRTRIEPNLFVNCNPNGATAWVFSYKVGETRVNMGLGPLHTISAKKASELALTYRIALSQGRDPRSERVAGRVNGADTFEKFLNAEIKRISSGHKDGRQADAWRAPFTGKNQTAGFLLPMPVASIDVADVVRAVEPIWLDDKGIRVIGERLLGYIAAVLENAQAAGARTNPLTTSLVKRLLPVGKKSSGHHAALDLDSLPGFVASLTERTSSVLGLRFLILTGARSSEVRAARWSEFNDDLTVWTIPADRMKAGRIHAVPLSKQATFLLRSIKRVDGNPFVFVGQKKGQHINETAFTNLKVMKATGATVHGFRSVFGAWSKKAGYDMELRELSLAHAISGKDADGKQVGNAKVIAAYMRDTLVEERRPMMQAWADYADAGNAIRLAA